MWVIDMFHLVIVSLEFLPKVANYPYHWDAVNVRGKIMMAVDFVFKMVWNYWVSYAWKAEY